MAAQLRGSALRKAEGLEEARRKWDHVRALVERVASGGGDQSSVALMNQIGRAAADVGRVLDEHGYGALAQSAAELGLVVQRAKLTPGKLRTMTEQVAGVRSSIDAAEAQLYKEAQEEAGDA
jgi:hypothetical protein